MQTQTVEIATIVNNGIVERIGRSTTYHPPIIEQKREMQWFDDNKLIKADKKWFLGCDGLAVGYSVILTLSAEMPYNNNQSNLY